MKKIMTIALATVLAGVASASCITWTVNSLPTGLAAGDVVELVWVGADNTVGNGSSTAWNLGADDAVARSGTLASTANQNVETKVTLNTAWPYTFAGSTVSASTTFKLYAVIYNATSTANATKVFVSTLTSAFTVNTSTSTQQPIYSSWTTYTPVPEPMTMALALVGVGAMALRRRFMKK